MTMFRKLVTIFILAPLALVIIMFAVANRQTVTIVFDPFNDVQPAFAMQMPLFVVIFVLVIFGVLIGGTAAWLRQSKWRRTALLLDPDIVALRREIEILNGRLNSHDARSQAAPETMRIPYRPA